MQHGKLINIRRHEKFWLLVLFLTAGVVRLVPEIVAYPYPIGYDVINYYLPVLSNFENHWNIVSSEFPLYVLLLYLISTGTSLAPNIIVPSAAIFLCGFFSISVYLLSRRIFELECSRSFFLSLFVIFQSSLMRTTWDLHKDLLSLTAMFFAISLGMTGRNVSNGVFVIVLSLCIISALADRMIGLLLVGTLVTYAVLKRRKIEVILASVTSVVFIAALLQGSDQIKTNVRIFSESVNTNDYNQLNLIILFVVTNGILLPFGIFGFINTRKTILKIPLLLSLIGSLSWLIYPYSSRLLPDRWIVIFSIFISVFAAYGITILIRKRSIYRSKREIFYFFAVLAPFVTVGMLFAITSSNLPISLFAPFHNYIGQFGPVTMQSNSISIPESKSIISAIDWINNNTPQGSNVVINKHWRGWTELELKDRKSLYYEDLARLVEHRQNYYMLMSATASTIPHNENAKVLLIHSNDSFLIYEIIFSNSI